MKSEDMGMGCGTIIFVVFAIVFIIAFIEFSLENLDTFIFGIIGLVILYVVAFLFLNYVTFLSEPVNYEIYPFFTAPCYYLFGAVVC
ncbi:MAG: hypothetical protein Q8P34_16185 [Bacteroidota bacterium]|nr:hypothetical protein [Bacteroidota bacterium]